MEPKGGRCADAGGPGEADWHVTLAAGEVVAIAVPDGTLVFDAADARKIGRFIETRVALAREASVDR